MVGSKATKNQKRVRSFLFKIRQPLGRLGYLDPKTKVGPSYVFSAWGVSHRARWVLDKYHLWLIYTQFCSGQTVANGRAHWHTHHVNKPA